ncbi:hypothetical protein NX786_00750 [Telluria mixta]|uniref:Uncharacterized protein n=1 Tax=Telluria mixta TaxID=34071 RepID=A0ABT2BS53_9BURK|nr:hypothetical protein [Telluria mixta]MCS0627876.1 hypothetical protein [Telluria mixta]WEM94006.1 hypothetical protein P0M04_21240 [Telluria mixta]
MYSKSTNKATLEIKVASGFHSNKLINHMLFPDEIPAVFVTHAAAVLADTNKGLSGSEIVRSCSAYAVDADVNIPFASYPFSSAMGTNKRTALFENIVALPSSWRFKIIQELCDHRSIQHGRGGAQAETPASLSLWTSLDRS